MTGDGGRWVGWRLVVEGLGRMSGDWVVMAADDSSLDDLQ